MFLYYYADMFIVKLTINKYTYDCKIIKRNHVCFLFKIIYLCVFAIYVVEHDDN